MPCGELRNTKRQLRRALPKGSALNTAAAELLEYLAAAPDDGSAAATGAFAEVADPQRPLPVPAELSAPRTADVLLRTEADSAADRIVREFGQNGGQPAPTACAQVDAAEAASVDVQHTVRLTVPAGRQQTMDDISEFFRRDSRRYDNGFAGGNGI